MTDKYVQNHHGDGNNVMNFGKQPFTLTEAHADMVVRNLPKNLPIIVEPIGSRKSVADATRLVAMLTRRGVQAALGDWVMVDSPPLEAAIEINEDGRIRLDSSK